MSVLTTGGTGLAGAVTRICVDNLHLSAQRYSPVPSVAEAVGEAQYLDQSAERREVLDMLPRLASKCWDYRCEPPHLASLFFLWERLFPPAKDSVVQRLSPGLMDPRTPSDLAQQAEVGEVWLEEASDESASSEKIDACWRTEESKGSFRKYFLKASTLKRKNQLLTSDKVDGELGALQLVKTACVWTQAKQFLVFRTQRASTGRKAISNSQKQLFEVCVCMLSGGGRPLFANGSANDLGKEKKSLALLPRMQWHDLGSLQPPLSASWVQVILLPQHSPTLVAGITGVHHHTRLIFVFLVEMGLCHVGQAVLERLTSEDVEDELIREEVILSPVPSVLKLQTASKPIDLSVAK
ncbi:putative ubiquitin carboxyl-terminal hydrolase MINDY-4, partial [Plecturocebus cupreus]